MDNRNVFLKPNVVIEPLFDRWYAWSHLISPATAAMNIVGRHLRILDSYIAEPDLHAAAVLNPKMRGGPFMDLKKGKVEDIKMLREKTLLHQRKLIQLANAIKELDQLLLSEAEGFGLETIYEKVPDILRGYIELYYDRNNNPNFRFFESLLYRSDYYNKNSQSIALWVTNNDHRPFVLSTPRLDEPEAIHLEIPFDHPG